MWYIWCCIMITGVPGAPCNIGGLEPLSKMPGHSFFCSLQSYLASWIFGHFGQHPRAARRRVLEARFVVAIPLHVATLLTVLAVAMSV